MALHMEEFARNSKNIHAAVQNWASTTDNRQLTTCDSVVPNDLPYLAFSASSISFSTEFQLRAVLGTPMPLSNFAANLEVPKPFGVWM